MMIGSTLLTPSTPRPRAGEVEPRSGEGEGAASSTPPPVTTDPSQSLPRDPRIWEAAQSFEAMAIGQLLGPMFDTVDTAHGLFGGGDAEAAWRPMLVDALGKQMQAQGGLGLAQPVYAAMLRAQEGAAGQPARRRMTHQPGMRQ
jgi:flagellar protein FlgJ